MGVLSKTRALTNRNFSKITKLTQNNSPEKQNDNDDNIYDNLCLEDFTFFVINENGECAVIFNSKAPKFQYNFAILLKKMCNFNPPTVIPIISRTSEVINSISNISEMKVKVEPDKNTIPEELNSLKNIVNCSDDEIKTLAFNLNFKDLSKPSLNNIVSFLKKRSRFFKKATLTGNSNGDNYIIDFISDEITKCTTLEINEHSEILKKPLEYLDVFFKKLTESFI